MVTGAAGGIGDSSLDVTGGDVSDETRQVYHLLQQHQLLRLEPFHLGLEAPAKCLHDKSVGWPETAVLIVRRLHQRPASTPSTCASPPPPPQSPSHCAYECTVTRRIICGYVLVM